MGQLIARSRVQCNAVANRSIVSKILTIDVKWLTCEAYGVSSMSLKSELYSASVIVYPYMIPCHIGLPDTLSRRYITHKLMVASNKHSI